ncbi:DUF4240 domain-containing protein [Pseudoalteromonas xiamenensis]|uniref:DUF4240 domain-containing protein n=1 Tax=Pseudoalteromonas xiamenensis TaxID=882626 RepID=UPI0035EF34A9
MNIETFWSLVTVENTTPSEVNAVLKSRLDSLSNEDLQAFDELYSRQLKQLWDWSCWGAAYVMCGCNSEYDYLDFCNWVISKGKDVYDSFKNTPDSIASLSDVPLKDELPYPYIDEMDLVAGLLYEEKNQDELVHFNVVNVPVTGKKFKNNKKALKGTYPNLFDKYWFKA